MQPGEPRAPEVRHRIGWLVWRAASLDFLGAELVFQQWLISQQGLNFDKATLWLVYV